MGRLVDQPWYKYGSPTQAADVVNNIGFFNCGLSITICAWLLHRHRLLMMKVRRHRAFCSVHHLQAELDTRIPDDPIEKWLPEALMNLPSAAETCSKVTMGYRVVQLH